MKKILTIGLLFCINIIQAQQNILPSKVFQLASKKNINPAKLQYTKIFNGEGGILASHSIQLIDIPSGKKIKETWVTNQERFYIIKTGLAYITLNGQATALNRGSVVCVLPNDKIEIQNNSLELLQVYEMSYSAGEKINIERGIKAGGSFITYWDNIKFKPHDKGGVRQYFDRPTAMLNRFDIHVTTLNVGNKSHDPHTHVNEEIILMLDGNAEMQIGTDHQKANPGDVVLLGSNILHNLTNVGTTPCLYFAIQWN